MKQIVSLLLFTLLCQYSFAQRTADTKVDSIVFWSAERIPEYPGGMAALNKYISDNIHYSGICEDLNSKVILRFIVEKDGSLSGFEFIKPVCAELKEHVVNMMKAMPKWVSASQNGVLVRCYYTLPIVVCLKE